MSVFPDIPPLHLQETIEALALGLCDFNGRAGVLHLLLRAEGGQESDRVPGQHIHLIFDRPLDTDTLQVDRSFPMSAYIYVESSDRMPSSAESLIVYPVTLNNSENWSELTAERLLTETKKVNIEVPYFSIVRARLLNATLGHIAADRHNSDRDMYKIRFAKEPKPVPVENPKSTVQIECAPDLT